MPWPLQAIDGPYMPPGCCSEVEGKSEGAVGGVQISMQPLHRISARFRENLANDGSAPWRVTFFCLPEMLHSIS